MDELKKTVIETERLILSPVTEADCTAAYLGWLNDSEVNKYLESGFRKHTMPDLLDFVRTQEKKAALFLAIKIKSNLKHIGNIKMEAVHPHHKTSEYGIMTGDKTEWGRGYAKEASVAVINYCFEKLGVRKITLGVITENKPAYEMYKKLGFKEEGLYKEHYFSNGVFLDVARMAVFRDEWISQKN